MLACHCLSCNEILVTQVLKKIPAKYYSSIKKEEYSAMYSGLLKDRYTGFGAKKTFLKFSFFSCISTKVYWNSDNDFSIHLIIWKGLEDKNGDRREKQWYKKPQSERKSCLPKRFHSYKYVIDHANVCFYVSANSLRYFVW